MVEPIQIPEFGDYHRTVIGYHGTRKSIALQIVQGISEFDRSTNSDDWLGDGIYFWEYGPQQAWWWAERRREQLAKKGKWPDGEEIAVVGSMIRLGRCFDLLDPLNIHTLKNFYTELCETYKVAGKDLPKNAHTHRYLDRAVFEYAYSALNDTTGATIDTCRAVYVPSDKSKRIWSRSWISEESHIQLCVRNPERILGTWLVRPRSQEDDQDESEDQSSETVLEANDVDSAANATHSAGDPEI